MAKNFAPSPYVCEIMYKTIKRKRYTYKLKNFDNVVYLPFEKTEIPVPADYDEVLTDRYDDWHEIPKYHKKHANVFSADVSYQKYFEQIKSIPHLEK